MEDQLIILRIVHEETKINHPSSVVLASQLIKSFQDVASNSAFYLDSAHDLEHQFTKSSGEAYK